MPRILLSGALANKPDNGGNAWSRLSWLRGFQQCGFDVWFVEQLSPAVPPAAARAWFRAVMSEYGLAGSSALLGAGEEILEGPPFAELLRRLRGTDLLFNFSGHLTQLDLRAAAACRLYYDDDPGFTQFWEQAKPGCARLEGHERFATLGVNIGSPDCPIPTVGRHWIATQPPVVLEDWPAQPPRAVSRFTTVASWRGAYGPITHGGVVYGVKAHEFRKVLELPRRATTADFEIALQIDPADARDAAALRDNGWRLTPPLEAAGTCAAFRRYIQSSDAEFSVAQGVYAGTRSGWFSDRTVRYLASGRPALVQDTGLSGHYPVGEGLLTFATMEEAAEGVRRIQSEPARHAREARRLAAEYFDAGRVVADLWRRLE